MASRIAYFISASPRSSRAWVPPVHLYLELATAAASTTTNGRQGELSYESDTSDLGIKQF